MRYELCSLADARATTKQVTVRNTTRVGGPQWRKAIQKLPTLPVMLVLSDSRCSRSSLLSGASAQKAATNDQKGGDCCYHDEVPAHVDPDATCVETR
jgi:hypothetical protein